MQKNYLILAHKNPEQLCRMIRTLDDGVSTFFIHVDAKVAIEPFKALSIRENAAFGEDS